MIDEKMSEELNGKMPCSNYGIHCLNPCVAECDLGNGWEDQVIYNDPEELRQQALKMGANIISYCFTVF